MGKNGGKNGLVSSSNSQFCTPVFWRREEEEREGPPFNNKNFYYHALLSPLSSSIF